LRSGAGLRQAATVVPEARIEQTEHGLVPAGDGWFVLNAKEARWRHAPGRPANCDFEREPYHFAQLGINITVLEPGVAMAIYHWEADQEDFLVLFGDALLIVEGQERPLRQWDLFHCPPETKHTIVGAGGGPCVILAVGARDRTKGAEWGGYVADAAATRHGAGVEEDTTDEEIAYGELESRVHLPYREGWLPE
jgi:uncharacterized cupin superfamily protein